MKHIATRCFVISILLGLLVLAAAWHADAQELRAFWVDAWHNGFKTASQVDTLIADCRTGNINTIFPQIRRRGDTYYPSPYEPFASDANPAFDALQYMIDQAHSGPQPIEVHAWFVMLPVWASTTPPSNPNHPFNLHPDWLTQDASGATWDGTNYSFDPGHPEAEEYLYNVVMDVITRYDVDGVNFDYIRFASGGDWGYNPVSVARFNARYGRTGQPVYTDDLWEQWRRDQITNLVRKIYLNMLAIKPWVKLSVCGVTWGNGPTSESAWYNTSAYSSVFQDWRAWMQEGIVDLNTPMTYYDQDTYPTYYQNWINYEKTHKYGHHLAVGLGAYLNDIADTFLQIEKSRELYSGQKAEGQVLYSYASTNTESVSTSQFCYYLSHGYQSSAAPYPTWVLPPGMPWKDSPTKGHIKGTVYNQMSWVDGATVSISGPESRSIYTDGTGFYGFAFLSPGVYTVTVTKSGLGTLTEYNVGVTAGAVTTVDFDFSPQQDPTPPVISDVAVTNVQDTSATITWTTDDPSTSQVEYGPTRSLGIFTAEDPTLVTSHSVTISGLSPNRVYHYRVISRNASDLSSTSARYLFFTAATYPGGSINIIIDNVDPGFSLPLGSWSTGTTASGRYGADYRFANTVSPPPTAIARWTPTITQAGPYNVYVWYPQGTNRANNAPYTVNYSGGSITIRVNQQTGGGQWNLIASGLQFASGTSGNVELSNDANPSVVIADAVKFEYAGPPESTPPSVPTGLTAAASSTTQIVLNWQASTDPSGIGGYKIYRNGVLIDGTTGATSYTDYELVPNTSYTYSVAAYDIYGNTSALSNPVARATLSLPLSSGSITCDRPIAVWQTASDAFTFTNTIGFGAGKMDHIRYVWDRNPIHVWTHNETSWSSGTVTAHANPGGNNWYLHAMSYNADNVPSGSGVDIGPYWCDTTAPETPVVSAAMYSTSSSQLSCSWTGGDPESGIAEYQYAIGTSAGGTDVRGWTSAGTNNSVTASGLSLALDQKYYFSIKSRNNAQVWGSAGNSGGTTIARVCSSVAEAKGYANGLAVVIPGRYVTWTGGGGIAVQDPDRTAGIMVPTTDTFAVGDIVQVGGILWTSGRDRLLAWPQVTKTGGPVSPKPLAMGSICLGGSDLNEWTPGIPGSYGPNNMGLLVRTWGMVTSSSPTSFYIWDGGSAAGAQRLVKVASAANPPIGSFVLVTGISSWTSEPPDILPYILTRSPDDVQVLP